MYAASRYQWHGWVITSYWVLWIFRTPPRIINGLVQERRNSIANALELRLSCTNTSNLYPLWIPLKTFILFQQGWKDEWMYPEENESEKQPCEIEAENILLLHETFCEFNCSTVSHPVLSKQGRNQKPFWLNVTKSYIIFSFRLIFFKI